ncbi:Cysteine--tRNA ligase 1, cytoplasmic [Glycine soja]
MTTSIYSCIEDHLDDIITKLTPTQLIFAGTQVSMASKLYDLILKMNTLETSQHSPSSSTIILSLRELLCEGRSQQVSVEMAEEQAKFRSHNLMTQQKEIFKTKAPGKVSMYVCRVTTYDFSHLGHTCAIVSFDNLFGAVLHYGHAAAPNGNTWEDKDMALFDMGADYHFYGCCFYATWSGAFLGIDTHDPRGYLKGLEIRKEPGLKSLRTIIDLREGMVIIVKPGYYFIDALLLAATINNPIISSLAILDTRWEDLRHGPRPLVLEI